MTLPKRRIIDAHIHLWDLDANYYPWLDDGDRPSLIKDISSLRRNYLVADFMRDAEGLNVVATVHIQAEHDHRDVVRETRWLQDVADEPASRGIPQAIVADADFAAPDIEAVLERHAAFRNTRGIRHVLHRRLNASPPYDPLENPAWVRNFALLQRHAMSFDMQLFPSQAAAALSLIRDNPEVMIALTHAGMPLWRDADGMARWRRTIRSLAELPNVWIKLSDFGSADPAWSTASIDPIVSEIIDAFGVGRTMLASNYPVERLWKPYREIWSIYGEYFSGFSADECDALFCQNAAAFYRIAS